MRHSLKYILIFALLLTSCNIEASKSPAVVNTVQAAAAPALPAFEQTPMPTRRAYAPGELVDYTAQSGDTLPALAARFNTTVEEIFLANPQIPRDATTMPPGMPMKIPIYYVALWSSPFQIIPDHAFVNGPTLIGFNTSAFVASHPGWLQSYQVYAAGEWRSGAEMVDYVAMNYSLSPRLLLAILEYQGGALSLPEPPVRKNLLGFRRAYYETPYLQLVIASNTLNNGYYSWRGGDLLEFELPDDSLFRPDPWQNAASVSLQYYFSRISSGDQYVSAIGPQGLFQTYASLFGNPWDDPFILIPGSLQQPELNLPFPLGRAWTYTGGPHTGWGNGEPLAAIDFAPPSDRSGCFIADKEQFATAMAGGLVVRSDEDGVIVDLDRDGDERTGWVLFYLHLAAEGRIPVGAEVEAGDPVGYPSCEGGRVTGTHEHIARKYNGEWILADGPLAFNLDGWIAHNGSRAYLGTLTNGNLTVTACECSDAFSRIFNE